MAFARGKQSKAISDRSGMSFPYTEMVKEWNGSLVHVSEFEPKHPTDVNGVRSDSGGATVTVIDLTLPGAFGYLSNNMKPIDGSKQNSNRNLFVACGTVEVDIT
jgi:hypothetical protein